MLLSHVHFYNIILQSNTWKNIWNPIPKASMYLPRLIHGTQKKKDESIQERNWTNSTGYHNTGRHFGAPATMVTRLSRPSGLRGSRQFSGRVNSQKRRKREARCPSDISSDETATIVTNRRTMRAGYRTREIIASGTRTNWPGRYL